MSTAERIVAQLKQEQERYDRGEPGAKPAIDWAKDFGYVAGRNDDDLVHTDVLTILDAVPTTLADASPRVPGAKGATTLGVGTLAPSKLRRLDVARMVREDPPAVPWRVHKMLADGSLTMVFSPPGEGKSLVAASFAAAVAVGESIAGLETREGRVVYIDAENGGWEIHRRVKALGLPADGVAVYETQDDFDLRKHAEEVERILEAERADVLILDSLRSLAPGLDENDSLECEAALAPIRRYAHDHGVAVLLIHHANKAGRTYRGSSAISAAVDISYRLGRAEGDPDRQRRFLEADKMRIGPEPGRLWLRIGVEHGMVLVGMAEPFETEEEPAPSPAQAELTPDVERVLRHGPARLADVARGIGRDPKDGTVRRVLERIGVKGEDGLWTLKEKVPSATAPRGLAPLAPSDPGEVDQ